MPDEGYWVDRAQSAEAKLSALQHTYQPVIDRIKAFKMAFGVKEDSDGKIDVDFDKFADAIGIDGALELRRIIDERYSITGEPGEKPRMRVAAA